MLRKILYSSTCKQQAILCSNFSTLGHRKALMVRHAESEFNKCVHLPTSFLEDCYKKNLHHNIKLMDCTLSQEGIKQAQNTLLPNQYLGQNREVDIIFVSPLTRTLETASILIKANSLNPKNIIVLPELTEVLSKICDFSMKIEEKEFRFTNFDFREMHRLVKQKNLQSLQEWQDFQVDEQWRHLIHKKEHYGHRYLTILQKVFPVPLQSSQRCFERSLRALQLMEMHSLRLNAHKILVVSHNRILKYLDGRFAKGQAKCFENCEIRQLNF